MKFILALALVTIAVAVNAAGIPDAQKEKAELIIKECKEKIPIEDAVFEKLKAGELTEPNEAAKCFANCFQEKAGFMKDGVFQADVFNAKFTESVGEEKAKALAAACSGVTGKDNCDKSFNLHQCLKKQGAY